MVEASGQERRRIALRSQPCGGETPGESRLSASHDRPNDAVREKNRPTRRPAESERTAGGGNKVHPDIYGVERSFAARERKRIYLSPAVRRRFTARALRARSLEWLIARVNPLPDFARVSQAFPRCRGVCGGMGEARIPLLPIAERWLSPRGYLPKMGGEQINQQ